MAKYNSPLRFTRSLGLPANALDAVGAFDPILGADTHLFIDPLALPHSTVAEIAQSGVRRMDQFFTEIYELVSASTKENDIPWQVARKYLAFHEISGTCLGYGAGTIRGSGWGPTSSNLLLARAKEIIDLGIKNPRLFILLGLFSEGIGPDMMSDMVTNILIEDLSAYTKRICDELKIPTLSFRVGSGIHHLPRNALQIGDVPVILVPRDVLRDLPFANSRDEVVAVAEHNERLRTGLNDKLGATWEKANKTQKSQALKAMLRDPKYASELMEKLLAAAPTPYDLTADERAYVIWTTLAYEAYGKDPKSIAAPRGTTVDDLNGVVKVIIEQFKFLLEERDLWKILHEAPPRKTEKTAQTMFFAVAYSYIRANNIDVTPEADTGNGPIDFKFSNGDTPKILVELKLSKGRVEHGYDEQLPKYMSAERADRGHYVVLDVGSLGKKWIAVQNLHKQRNDPRYSIYLMDASFRPSASKI